MEIAENEQVADYAASLAVRARLPHVRLAVDDTGSGYSSLSHVLHLEPAFVELPEQRDPCVDDDAIST